MLEKDEEHDNHHNMNIEQQNRAPLFKHLPTFYFFVSSFHKFIYFTWFSALLIRSDVQELTLGEGASVVSIFPDINNKPLQASAYYL